MATVVSAVPAQQGLQGSSDDEVTPPAPFTLASSPAASSRCTGHLSETMMSHNATPRSFTPYFFGVLDARLHPSTPLLPSEISQFVAFNEKWSHSYRKNGITVTPLHSAASLGFAASNLSAAKQLAADVNLGLAELMNELESLESESSSDDSSSSDSPPSPQPDRAFAVPVDTARRIKRNKRKKDVDMNPSITDIEPGFPTGPRFVQQQFPQIEKDARLVKAVAKAAALSAKPTITADAAKANLEAAAAAHPSIAASQMRAQSGGTAKSYGFFHRGASLPPNPSVTSPAAVTPQSPTVQPAPATLPAAASKKIAPNRPVMITQTVNAPRTALPQRTAATVTATVLTAPAPNGHIHIHGHAHVHPSEDNPSIRGRKRKTKTSLSGQDGDDDGIHVYEQDDDVLMTSQPSGAVLVRHQYRTELGGANPTGQVAVNNVNLAELDEDTDEDELPPVAYAHPTIRSKKAAASVLAKKAAAEQCTNPMYSRKGRIASKIKRVGQQVDDSIWNTEETEERRRVKEFWLGLPEESRNSLIKLEKDGVLKKMKEQQKHTCNCSVCGRRRNAIEEELEMLYDAYYEELERYTERQGEPGGFNFFKNLGAKSGMLSVADDLMKNEGKRFLEMMERLAERRLRTHPGHDDFLDTHVKDQDDDHDDDDDLTEEQRLEEGKRMFQMFAAKMFEQRIMAAYREKNALEKQQKLIEEEENRERVAQAKKESQKKKKDAKKQKRKQKQEEEVRVRAQQEAEARAKAEKEKQEKQEQQRKRDEEKRRVEEDRRKKEEEARKKRDEEQRKKDEAERKRREEEQRKKDEAERKRKEQEAHRQAQAQEDQAKADAQAKLQAERMLQQQQQAPVASVAVGLPQTASVALSESDGDSEPIKKKKNRRKQKKKNEVKEEQYIPGMNKLGAASASSKPKPDSSSIPGLATTMSAPVKTQAHPVSPREQNMAPPAPLVSEVNAELAPQIRVSKKPDPNAPAFQPRGKMPIHVPSPSAATAQWYGPFAGPAGQFPPGTIPPYGGARPPQANTYSTFTPTANPVPGASQPPAQPVRAKTAASSPVTGNTKYPVAPGQQAKSPAKGNTRYAPKSSQNGGHAPTNKPVDSVNTLDFETNMDLGSVGNLLPNSVISGLDAPSPAVAPAASPKPPSPPVYSSSPASSNAPSKLDPVVSTQSVLFNRGVVNAPGSRPATVANSPAGSPNPLTASTDSLALSRENFMLVSPAHQPPLHDTHNSTVPVISPIPTSTTSLLAEIRSDQDEVVTPKGRGFLPIDSSVPGSWATSKQQPFSKAISPSLPIGHAKPITNSPHIGPKPILINNDLGSFRPSITMDTSIWGDSLMSETMPSLQGGGFGGLPMPPAPASSNNHVSPGFSTAPGTGW